MNNTLKLFIKYVSLNVAGMIALSCYILADTFFVAKALGSDGLAALNFSISIYSVLQGFGLMIGIGGATRYTILKNSGEREKASEVFTHALTIGAVVAVVFFIIGLFFTAPLATLLGADEVTLPLTNVYLRTLLLFAPCFVANNILLAFVRNDGNPKLSMCAMMLSSLSNIVLDYVFMFPFGMGMFGAAFATGLSPAISLCALSLHFFRGKNHFSLKRCKIHFKRMLDIAFLGMSSFIGELSSAVVLITFNLVILRIEGNIGVAAYGVVANIALIAAAIFAGVAQGAQPLASKGYGSGDKHMMRQVMKYSAVTAILLACLVYGTIYFGNAGIVSIFNGEGNATLAALAENGMRIYFFGFFFAGINIIAAAYFSATANATTAFCISSLRGFLLLIPAVMILSTVLGMQGVWFSFVLTEFIVCLLTVISLFRYHHKIRA